MARPARVYEILEKTNKLGKKEERIEYLRENEGTALKDILRIALDNTISLDALPEGTPPYKAFEGTDRRPEPPRELIYEYGQFRNFIKAISPNLNQFKREQMFVDLLESIHPEDAKLLCDAKDKNIKLKYITKALIKAAFPDLIVK